MRLKKFALKLFKAIVFTYTLLSGSFVWFDFLISTETEFMSLASEKIILLTFFIGLGFTIYFLNEEEEKNRKRS
jgi:hypothetical protein